MNLIGLVIAGLAFGSLVSRWYRTPSDESVREKPLAQPSELRSQEGQEAIYTENGVVAHVRVEHVYCDGWGADAELIILASPGLFTGVATELEPGFTVGCCWAYLYTGRATWHSSGQGAQWSLFFDPELIQEIVKLGASIQGKGNQRERLRILRDRLSQAFVDSCRG